MSGVTRVGHLRALDVMLIASPPLFWAGNFVVGRAMRGNLPPFTMSGLRWALALLVILPFAWRPMRRDWAYHRRHPWRLAALSLTGVVAFNSFVYLGLTSTDAANGLLLNSTIPALIMLLGTVFYRQRLRASRLLGLLLSLGGVATIILRGDPVALASLDFALGDLIVFCGMVSWACYTLWLRAVPPEIHRVGLLGVQIVMAMPLLAPLALWEFSTGMRPVWTSASVAALCYLGVFPSVLAYLAYNMSVARFGATAAGLSIHLIPVFGVMLAVVLLGEPLRLFHLIGFGLIAAGLILAGAVRWRGS